MALSPSARSAGGDKGGDMGLGDEGGVATLAVERGVPLSLFSGQSRVASSSLELHREAEEERERSSREEGVAWLRRADDS